jgi:hypothetical protein
MMPREFQQLVAQCCSLAGQVAGGSRSVGHSAARASVGAAADGFLQRLGQAYGPSHAAATQCHTQQHQQHCQSQQQQLMDVPAFVAQAQFVGLTSAALWAVQVRRPAEVC